MSYLDSPQTQKANRKFVRAAMSIPLLEREHEQHLARRWRENGDEQALHELVSPYLRLVISTAGRFRSYGLPIGDLVQEGNIGLMQAAARFDPARNVLFSTYSTWWIRSSMQEFVMRNWSIVRTGTTAAQKSLFFNLRRLRAKLLEDGAGGLLDAKGRSQVAHTLNVPDRDVEAMDMRLLAHDFSLNSPVAEDNDGEWQDFLPDEGPGPEEIVASAHDAQTQSEWIRKAMADLTEREQTIIRERRLSETGKTLETLGGELGISKERVRQIEQEAMGKLRISISLIAGPEAIAYRTQT
jgi:RNA polymerase sigma-32 factor